MCGSEENKTLRILVFSGDDDSVCATRGTQLWIDRLNWTPIQDWTPWEVNHQVAGYKKKFENDFTFATVRAAGHEVRTHHRPAAAAKEAPSERPALPSHARAYLLWFMSLWRQVPAYKPEAALKLFSDYLNNSL